MKSYRNIVVTVFVLLTLTIVARGVQLATRPAEPQSDLVAQAATTPAGQLPSAQRPGAQQGQGVPLGTGPASELLKLIGVNSPDFGIKVVQTFNATGRPAYET